jgi:SAM-dependent methyltransferase
VATETNEGRSAPMRLEDELENLYALRFSDAERRSKAQLWEVLCDAFFSRHVPAEGTVLDIGAGYCDFSNNIRARRRIAVDLNPDTRRHAAEGVEVFSVPLEQMGDVIEPGTVDFAFASNVFEHLRGPDALLEVLSAIRRALRPGGRLMIVQPNIRHVGVKFWDFFDHTLPLTEKGMAEALSVSGFEVAELHDRFLPYTTKGKLRWTPRLVRLYLALPLAWRFLGEQMLVIARKP